MTIVATGLCVNSAMEAAGILEQQGISVEVIDICTIKPLDEELLLASAAKTKHVVTAEEGWIFRQDSAASASATASASPEPWKS